VRPYSAEEQRSAGAARAAPPDRGAGVAAPAVPAAGAAGRAHSVPPATSSPAFDPRCKCRCMTWRAPFTWPWVPGFMDHARRRRAKRAVVGAARRHLDRARPPMAMAPFRRWRRAATRSGLLRSGLPDVARHDIQSILSPRFLTYMASYDVASNVCWALCGGGSSRRQRGRGGRTSPGTAATPAPPTWRGWSWRGTASAGGSRRRAPAAAAAARAAQW